MKRLFFALWPDDSTRQQVDRLNHQLDGAGRKLIPQNLHVTLVFLGNVEDEIAEAVERQAADIDAAPLELVFDELDYWKRPRVICLTCRRQPDSVYDLVNKLTRMISAFPVRLDQRPFRAHITLARKAQQRPDFDFEPIRLKAYDFALVQSVSTENGVRYHVLASWPLSG